MGEPFRPGSPRAPEGWCFQRGTYRRQRPSEAPPAMITTGWHLRPIHAHPDSPDQHPPPQAAAPPTPTTAAPRCSTRTPKHGHRVLTPTTMPTPDRRPARSLPSARDSASAATTARPVRRGQRSDRCSKGGANTMTTLTDATAPCATARYASACAARALLEGGRLASSATGPMLGRDRRTSATGHGAGPPLHRGPTPNRPSPDPGLGLGAMPRIGHRPHARCALEPLPKTGPVRAAHRGSALDVASLRVAHRSATPGPARLRPCDRAPAPAALALLRTRTPGRYESGLGNAPRTGHQPLP